MKKTPQQTFDTVAKHLLTQKRRAMTESGFCRYRTADGLKCAVGGLIPDELYSKTMEGGAAAYSLEDAQLRSGPTLEVTRTLVDLGYEDALELLSQLQELHDNGEVTEWPEKLLEIGTDAGLNVDIVDELTRT